MPSTRTIIHPKGERYIVIPQPGQEYNITEDEEIMLWLAARIDIAEMKLDEIERVFNKDKVIEASSSGASIISTEKMERNSNNGDKE